MKTVLLSVSLVPFVYWHRYLLVSIILVFQFNRKASPRRLFKSTLNEAGMFDWLIFFSFHYCVERGGAARMSSDLWSKLHARCARRRDLKAHTSISPKRCPPPCAFPPSGCWVIRGVWADGSHVNLIFHHVMEFKNIHIADSDFLLKFSSRSSVVERHFTI